MSDEDKKLSRSARFGSIDASSDLALQKRAERFGTGNSNNNKIQNNTSVDSDTLKKRADRFGISTEQATKSITKAENDEKKKSRAERFGLTAQATSSRNNDDELAAKRAKKFGTVSASSTDDSKRADRAKRFAI